jgi:hypothetical protein
MLRLSHRESRRALSALRQTGRNRLAAMASYNNATNSSMVRMPYVFQPSTTLASPSF